LGLTPLSLAKKVENQNVTQFIEQKIELNSKTQKVERKRTIITKFGEEDCDVVTRRHLFLEEFVKRKRTISDFHSLTQSTSRKCGYCGAEEDQDGMKERSNSDAIGSIYCKVLAFFEERIESSQIESDRETLTNAFLSIERVIFSSLYAAQSCTSRYQSIKGNIIEKDVDMQFGVGQNAHKDADITHEAYFRNNSNATRINDLTNDEAFALFVSFIENHKTEEVILFLSSHDISKLHQITKGEVGISLLHLVCSLGLVEVAARMIQSGFPPKTLTLDGRYPIHFFLESGLLKREKERKEEEDVDVVRFLKAVLGGISPNYVLPSTPKIPTDIKGYYQSHKGDSLLHIAARSGCVNMVIHLLSLGANFAVRNECNVCAMEEMIRFHSEDVGHKMLKLILDTIQQTQLTEMAGMLLGLGVYVF
jgi:hypothetical protein